MKERSDLRHIERAIPGAAIMVVRLHAPLDVVEARIREREPDPEDELTAAGWWFTHFERSPVEDHLVETDHRAGPDAALEVLRVSGWLS